MAFTKSILNFRGYWVTLITFLALAITSCGSLPGADPTHGASAADSELEASPRVLQPNPYLENVPRISADTEATFNRGLTAMEAENWSEAELIFQELTVTDPRLSGPWVNLGIVHYHMDAIETAEADWNTAISLNPFNFDAYNQLAVLKREQGDFSGAETIYLNSLAKWPDNPEAHCNLGILYDLYMGLWAQALAEYQECADLTEEPSRQLRGWIIDMERRIQSQAAE